MTGGTRFCTVALNVFGYSVWNLLYSFVGNGLRISRILKTYRPKIWHAELLPSVKYKAINVTVELQSLSKYSDLNPMLSLSNLNLKFMLFLRLYSLVSKFINQAVRN